MTDKEFLKMSLVQKGDFIKAWGQDPWAGSYGDRTGNSGWEGVRDIVNL